MIWQSVCSISDSSSRESSSSSSSTPQSCTRYLYVGRLQHPAQEDDALFGAPFELVQEREKDAAEKPKLERGGGVVRL